MHSIQKLLWVNLFTFIFTITSCANQKSFDSALDSNDCEKALEEIPENKTEYKLYSKAQSATGTALSYTATGAAYIVEFTWDVTVGITSAVILCAPMAALVLASSSKGAGGSGELLCPPVNVNPALSPPLGKNTKKNTEKWECPNVDNLSRSVRKVAQCYRNKGNLDSITKSENTLNSVRESKVFFRCLSNNERENFLADLKQVRDMKRSLETQNQ